jgi:hypothetical protein
MPCMCCCSDAGCAEGRTRRQMSSDGRELLTTGRDGSETMIEIDCGLVHRATCGPWLLVGGQASVSSSFGCRAHSPAGCSLQHSLGARNTA